MGPLKFRKTCNHFFTGKQMRQTNKFFLVALTMLWITWYPKPNKEQLAPRENKALGRPPKPHGVLQHRNWNPNDVGAQTKRKP